MFLFQVLLDVARGNPILTINVLTTITYCNQWIVSRLNMAHPGGNLCLAGWMASHGDKATPVVGLLSLLGVGTLGDLSKYRQSLPKDINYTKYSLPLSPNSREVIKFLVRGTLQSFLELLEVLFEHFCVANLLLSIEEKLSC
jgi:hypothetical protein